MRYVAAVGGEDTDLTAAPGHIPTCELLETYQLTPAAFEQKLRDLDIQGDEFVILLSEEYS